MRPKESMKAKKFLNRLINLASDTSGGMGYRVYADRLIQDVTGLENVVTKVLSTSNPVLAAYRLMDHPYSENLAELLLDPDDSIILADLVVVLYEATQLARTPKRKRNKKTLKAYRYLMDLYRTGIKKLQAKYKYDSSPKQVYKRRFEDLDRHLNRGYNDYYYDLSYRDDDDDDDLDDLDDDDEDLLEDDAEYQYNLNYERLPKPNGATRPRRASRTPMSDNLDDIMSIPAEYERDGDDLSRDQIINRLANSMRENPEYNPADTEDVNFDFSGKIAIQNISDKMESLVEGMQLILNRLYGRELTEVDEIPNLVKPAPHKPEIIVDHNKTSHQIPSKHNVNPELNDFIGGLLSLKCFENIEHLDRKECIKLYNSITRALEGIGIDENETEVEVKSTVKEDIYTQIEDLREDSDMDDIDDDDTDEETVAEEEDIEETIVSEPTILGDDIIDDPDVESSNVTVMVSDKEETTDEDEPVIATPTTTPIEVTWDSDNTRSASVAEIFNQEDSE